MPGMGSFSEIVSRIIPHAWQVARKSSLGLEPIYYFPSRCQGALSFLEALLVAAFQHCFEFGTEAVSLFLMKSETPVNNP